MSEASDGYSEDFDEEIDDTDPDNRTPYFSKKAARDKTPALKLYQPIGQIKEFSTNTRNRQVANRGANSLPILGRGGARDRIPLRTSKRMVSHDAAKPPNDRVLSANIRTIRSLQSSLKEKELQIEQLVKDNRLYKRFDILAQKEVTRMEKEHKSVPELMKRHEIEIALHKERYKKLQKEHSDIFRRKEQLERELGQSKFKLTELKRISDNKKLEERHQLSLRLQEEIERSEQLSQRLQESGKKLAIQEKTSRREKAELEDKCKRRERRISLMEQSVREMDSEMRTKKKQLEKLNLYSLRIEKNLPQNVNLSDFITPQEDRGTMTSPCPLPSDANQSGEEEPRFALPPTCSQVHTSNSVHFPRSTGAQFHRQSQAYNPNNTSEVSLYTIKPQYADIISPPMTHSEPGNYSESDTMPTLHTSSDLTSFTTNPTPIEAKSTPISNDVISPTTQPVLADPPLSTIRENSTLKDNPSVRNSLRKSLQHEDTQRSNPTNLGSVTQPVRKQPSDNQLISSTQKDALLKKLKQIDTNQSSSGNESHPSESIASTRDSQPLTGPDRRPENSDAKTRGFKQDTQSGNSTPVGQSETGGKGKKKKTLALDDLFSDASAQSSESKPQASTNMDPGVFSAPRDSPPLFSPDTKPRQFVARENNPLKQNDPPTNSVGTNSASEEVSELSKKPSVVENMYQGKPAYSTEEDFYGARIKFPHSSPGKAPNPFEFDSAKKPQHGRRAKDSDSPTHADRDYYWENTAPQNKPDMRRVPTPVDDIEDDLEVIQL